MSPNKESPTKEQLYNLLTSEISHILDEQKQPGWSRWAILGSFAALIWFSLDILASQAFSIPNVLLLILIFRIGFDCIKPLFAMLTADEQPTNLRPRLNLSFQLSPARPLMVFYIAQYIAIIYIATNFLPVTYSFYRYVLIAFASLMVGISIVGLLFTFLRIPIPIIPSTSSKIAMIIPNVLALWAVTFLFASLLSNSSMFLFADYKMALLIFGDAYLVELYLKTEQKSPLLISLVETRRKLIFGETDTETAVRQADIALRGMQTGDIFQEDVSTILKLVDEMNAQISVIDQKLTAINSAMAGAGSEQTTEEQTLITGTSESVSSDLKKVESLSDEIGKCLKALNGRVSFIRPMVGQAEIETEVLGKIKDAFQVTKEKTSALKSKIHITRAATS